MSTFGTAPRTQIPEVDRALKEVYRALGDLSIATGLNERSSGTVLSGLERQEKVIKGLSKYRIDSEARIETGEASIRAVVRAGSLTRVSEDADLSRQTSISVDPLEVTIPSGRDLVLVDVVLGEVREQVVTLSQIARTGDEVLNIEEEAINLKDGMYVLPAAQTQQADMWITPYFIRQSVESERKGRNVGTTNAELDGALNTANVDLKEDLKDNDEIEFIHRIDGSTVVAYVDGNVSAGSGVTLNFDDGAAGTVTFDELPAESGIRLTDKEIKGTLTIQDGSISANTSNISGNSSSIASLDLRADDLEAEVVLKAEVTAGEITKIASIRMDASVSGGSAVTLSGDYINLTANTGGVIEGNYSAGSTGLQLDLSTGNAEFNDITARGSIETADSGKRVELRSSDNEMEFFDASGSVLRIGSSVSGSSPGLFIASGGHANVDNFTSRTEFEHIGSVFFVPNLPTSAPGTAGQWWNDSGTVKIA